MGLDIDSTKIGVTIIDINDGNLIYSDKITSQYRYFDRTVNLYRQLLIVLNQYNIVFAIIEDYGYSPVQRNAVNKAELIGLIKYKLEKERIPFLKWLSIVKKRSKTYTTECMCSPSQLLKFIFGIGKIPSTGKSSKLMLKVFKDTGYEFKTDDECDAFMLAQAGRIFYWNYKNGNKKIVAPYESAIKLPIDSELRKGRINSKLLVLNEKQIEPINLWLENYNGRRIK